MNDPGIAPGTELKAENLATLVATLNRFLMRFAAMPAFQEAGLGLAEWSALSIIAQRDGLNNRKLANLLGVSPQRINQITDSLKGVGFIALSSSAEDGRQRIISITPTGVACVRDLNAKLQPKIEAALHKRPALLVRTNRLLNVTLMRIVAPSDDERRVAKQRMLTAKQSGQKRQNRVTAK